MAEPKDNPSFFRKVVKFVANPATDWSDINTPPAEPGEAELERSELKAMVERKRRNDFVRKREFDTLRRLRREGLSPEQLAALGHNSRIDDSEGRMSESSLKQDTRVKDKIDEIEQQMVDEGFQPTAIRRTGFGDTTVEPPPGVAGERARPPAPSRRGPLTPREPPPSRLSDDSIPSSLPPVRPGFDVPLSVRPGPVGSAQGRAVAPSQAPRPAAAPTAPSRMPTDMGSDVLVNEVVHDPDLDESVIAFANADFSQSEHALTHLVTPGGLRYQHAETWLVLFDLYRAIGQQPRFEALALDYANLFGSSAPQWFSMPRMVADAAAHERVALPPRQSSEIGWISPPLLDVEAVARLRSATLQLPLPWVLDWSAVRTVEPEAATELTMLLREWAPQRVEMRWMSGEQLLATLYEAAPSGAKDADPAYWMARLEALRLSNRPDQFDECAIDFCMTYEMSPPSWEHSECVVRIRGASLSTAAPPLSIISEVSTSFLDTNLQDEPQSLELATVELSGQLVGDISATLAKLDKSLAQAPLIQVNCTRLIRVDFIAAGDLLNWVLAKRGQERQVTFTDAHRLLALFFGAMGITEHARVQIRRD